MHRPYPTLSPAARPAKLAAHKTNSFLFWPPTQKFGLLASACDCGVRITGTPIYEQAFDPPQSQRLRAGLPAPEPFGYQQAARFRARSLQTGYPVEVYPRDRLPFRGYSSFQSLIFNNHWRTFFQKLFKRLFQEGRRNQHPDETGRRSAHRTDSSCGEPVATAPPKQKRPAGLCSRHR
jgi:hypothetical protein